MPKPPPKLKGAIEVPWSSWVGTAPEWILVLLTAGSGILGTLGGLQTEPGRARPILLWAAAGCILMAVLIAAARHSREKKLSAFIRDEIHWLFDERLSPLLQQMAEVVATHNKTDRCNLAAMLRSSAVAAAADLVGRTAPNGTRANLFRLRETSHGFRMRLEPGCCAGRGDKSSRVFDESHPTMTLTLANKYRFVPSVSELPNGDDLKYETFMTCPVSALDSRIWGTLTVDCLKAGQLTLEDDLPVMQVLAAIIAVSYECESYPTLRKPKGD